MLGLPLSVQKKMLSLPKSSEVCFDEYPLFPTEESKHQVSTKKSWIQGLCQSERQAEQIQDVTRSSAELKGTNTKLPNLLNPNRYSIAIIDNQ